MRRPILFLLMSLVGSAAALSAQAQGSDLDQILAHFTGYHLLKLTERDAATKAFIVHHFPKDNPSVVHADFDGDGHLDYALLLKADKSSAAKLVVLLCSAAASCTKVYDLDLRGYAEIVYFKPVPIGSRVAQTEAIDTKDYPAPVKLTTTGIALSYFGKAEVVYYWNKKHKKMESVQTGD